MTGLSYLSSSNITYSSTNNKPYYFSNSPIIGTTDEGYYQLAFLPKAFLNDDSAIPKKILFVVDYEASNTGFSQQQILNTIKRNILENLSPRDSFNIFYNRLTTKKLSSTWIPADSAKIEQAFAVLRDPSVGIGNSSVLNSLLVDGYDFLKAQRSGEMMIISSNDAYSAFTTVQSFYSDLTNQFTSLPTTHAFDFSSRGLIPSFWSQNTYYYGNELLYRVLTSNTRGNFVNMTNWNPVFSDIEKGTSDIFQQLVPYAPIDMIVKPTTGLTFERFDLQSSNTSSANRPFLQIGKYKGSFPFTVDITTTNAVNQLVTGRLSLPANPTAVNDSSNRQLHGANKIQVLESTPTNNTLINKIIQESKAHRILSRYTAFIALEPNLQTPCDTCKDETGGVRTSVVDAKSDSVKITVYPNPFRESVTISIEKPVSAKVENALIFNTLGQCIKTFNEAELKSNTGKLTLTWQDLNISAGTYIFSTTINGKKFVQKLVKIRE
ncbi:MAG: T9SS type A sorting domain-containing protein [Saprospiraceae bacterium]|nr:T9SS type A sorting domain-containing protein [Saprospiraceae bacterium]